MVTVKQWLNKKRIPLNEEYAVMIFVLPSPEKGQIDDGREGIHKLQDEGLKDESLFEALLRLWDL